MQYIKDSVRKLGPAVLIDGEVVDDYLFSQNLNECVEVVIKDSKIKPITKKQREA